MDQDTIKILMIDDDREDFDIISHIVKSTVTYQYSIDWCSSYNEGLKLIALKEHDVYLVDYNLGARNGLELIKTAIEQGCEAPLIILTGDNNYEIDKQALEAGASDYLVKGSLSGQMIERAIRYGIANADQLKQMNKLNAELEARVKDRTQSLEETLTELKKFQAELIKSKNEAERAAKFAEDASKSKTHFLSSMSHEIRTPMNAILGFTKLVLNTDLNEKQREYLNAIKTSGDILIVLINDILDLAKVESGKMTFVKSPFKLSACITEILQLFESSVEEKKLSLKKEYDSSIPEVLVGDSVRLNQIILNLISNAIKFTQKGKIVVKVALLNEDAEKATIQFSVIDSGIGIPENKLNSIFEKFEQASDKTSKIYGGTGLGLPIAKQFVELQGGSISVESKVNEGSTFSFILSFDKTKSAAKRKKEVPSAIPTEKKEVKVLVAEDEKLNQLLIETIIEQFGFKIDIAKDGKVATEMLKKNKYDIVLMDVHMPVMDGFEATEYIRSNVDSTIPIIALTADVTTIDAKKCKTVGMTDYISKPIDDKLLYDTIIKHTNGSIAKKARERKEKKAARSKHQLINLKYIDMLTRGNEQGKLRFISSYLEEIPSLVNKMKQSMANEDWDELRMATHKLIPSFALMGIKKEFEEAARKVEKNAINKENPEEINELVGKIDTVCKQACEELRALNYELKIKKV